MEKSYTQSKTRLLVINGLIAALYIILTVAVAPVSQGPVQFRVSESLNHLVVFNKKLLWGVVAGVVLFNLLFSEGGILDVIFGGGQTLIALLITAYSAKWIKDEKKRMVVNIIVFTLSMVLIAIMICLISNEAIGSPVFWTIYGSLMLSEAIVMTISAPIMFLINKIIHFERY
ncbi:hypothetical protein CBF34_06440 [Vagococcus penaei]|uniref:Uncharacterized protein n=1 Tax=Vagococcus penaei TaxID=633807 RepID=A0A1Q2D781_9ENTE|nr:QueT transporter family protein [Vagococcus penaei]AQP54171.1 hypothetical protein BW732_08020 [Vagococcus penaei]RSU02170.1 hypothetical protein CBF34_06440 [Vagococcus penaei]